MSKPLSYSKGCTCELSEITTGGQIRYPNYSCPAHNPKAEPPKDEVNLQKEIHKLGRMLYNAGLCKQTTDGSSTRTIEAHVSEILAILKLQQEATRIDERTQFIKDDKNGRNAVYIAKQKQLHFHDHHFGLSSYICSCGISKADTQELDKLTPADLNKLRLEL